MVHSSDEDRFATNTISKGFGYIDSFGIVAKLRVCSRGHDEIVSENIEWEEISGVWSNGKYSGCVCV